MGRATALLALVAGMVFLTGCMGMPMGYGPSGMAMGQVYTNVTYPSDNTSRTEYQMRSEDFQIAGPVRGEGASHSILGLIAFGDSGYGEALKQAQGMGADDIINLRLDTRYLNFLYIYGRVDTIITGTGVKWKKLK